VTTRTQQPTRHSGQVMIVFALGVVVLTGFVALGIDVGHALAQRRELQNSADAAALAVAQAMLVGTTDRDVLNDTATSYVAGNGFDHASLSVSIDTVAKPETVTVDVTSNVQKFFVGLVYQGPWKAKAHAVAALDPTTADYALLALDQSGNPINLTGSSMSIHIVGGSAMSNAGMQCVGSGSIIADHEMNTNTSFTQVGSCHFSGTTGTNTGSTVVSDPLASVPPPMKPSAPALGSSANCSGSGSSYECPPGKHSSVPAIVGDNKTLTFDAGNHQVVNTTVNVVGNNDTVVFNPGTYYFKSSSLSFTGTGDRVVFNPGTYLFYMENGSMSFTGSSNGFDTSNINVEFYFKNSNVSFTGSASGSLPPGIYYFDGTGPTITGTQKLTGDNVLFYLDNGAKFNTTGTTQYSFTAASTSLYSGGQPGMLIYSARGNSSTFSFTGSSGDYLKGIVYMPDGTLQLTGTTTGTWAEGQLIVDKLNNTGTINVSIKYKDYVDITSPSVYLIQ
jgi:Flp pilus assembly protein TadG